MGYLKLDFRCCKLAQKTGGQSHSRDCSGRPPDLHRKKTIRLTKDGVELIEDPLYEDIKPEDLIGVEIKMDQPTFEKSKVFTIKLESQFIPTPTMVKQKLGIGYKVLAVEIEKESSITIKDVDSAVDALIKTGYRALIRVHHPDVGGSTEVTAILNRAKKELDDLIKEVRG